MKRIVLSLFLLAGLLVLAIVFIFNWTIKSSHPSYRKTGSKVTVGPFRHVSYDFSSARPFQDGEMWVEAYGSNNFHSYLFDIERQTVLGELTNGWPVFMNGDQTKLLCEIREPSLKKSLFAGICDAVTQMTDGRIDMGRTGADKEVFWVLDLERNKATKIGHVYQVLGTGSYFPASPTSRFGFNQPSTHHGSGEFYVCDLEEYTMRKHRTGGTPQWWWDDQRLVLKATNKDLLLYDVVTLKQEPFIPFSKFKSFYTDSGLTNDPTRATFFIMWNGHENEFYFTDGDSEWAAKPSFLAKIVRPGPTLKLIDPHFKFEWSDHFNANENYYLYTGREMGYTNSAVYLRDLKNKQLRELIPPDPNHTNVFSIPRFYGESVIYVRSNMLWRIDLDGSNNRPLFFPEMQREARTNQN